MVSEYVVVLFFYCMYHPYNIDAHYAFIVDMYVVFVVYIMIGDCECILPYFYLIFLVSAALFYSYLLN